MIMASIYEMLSELNDLRSYQDLSEWEDGFIESVWDQVVKANHSTTGLSEKQVDKIQQLHEKRIVRGI